MTSVGLKVQDACKLKAKAKLTYHVGQVVYDFNLPDIISGLPEISYNIMPECHVLFLMDLMIVKPFSFKFCCIVSIFLGICGIFLYKRCVMLKKSDCPFGQVKTKMYLPEMPFFKNSLAGASGLVLMSNPVKCFIPHLKV